MMTFLAVVHIIACLGLITLVLMQDSKGGGVFTSQSTSNSVLGAGGATSLAQTMTKVLASLFAITCIALSVVSARSQKSVIDSLPAAAAQTTTAPAAAATPAPATPEATKTETTATSQNAAAPAPAATEKK